MADEEKAAVVAKPKRERSVEDMAVLKRHWTRQLRAKKAEIEDAAAKVAGLRKGLTALVNEAKADFADSAYTRERMLGWVTIATTPIRTDMRKSQQDYEDRRDLGAYIHHEQQDMFAGLPQEAADQVFWERAGEQAGLAGKDDTAPAEMHARFATDYAKGWQRGQAKVQEDYLAAQALKKAPEPDPATETVDLNDEEQELDLDEAARKLRRSGFTERTSANDQVAA